MVLLCFGTSSCSRNRPVKFVGGKKLLLIATLAVFRDLVEPDASVVLQIRVHLY